MNLRTWLDERLAEGPGRLELWQIAKATDPQTWVRTWPLSGAETRADDRLDEIAALTSAPVRKLVGHVLLAFDPGAEEARARAMLRGGRVFTSGSGSAPLEDRNLECFLFQCEIGARLQRRLANFGSRQGRRP